MQRFQNTYTGSGNAAGRPGGDWSAEISGTGTNSVPGMTGGNGRPAASGAYAALPNGQLIPMGNMPGIREELPEEVIQSPVSVEEAHKGSLKAMLARNEGNYVVATFLVGTQGTVSWEGILYDVGNDFITIYQPGRERYIVIDIYALKYIEFFDTRRREQCEAMLDENGWQDRY